MRKRDAIVASLTILLLGAVVFCSRAKKIAQSINCGNYMSSIGFVARIWSEDNSNRLADNFLVMSNELATPKVLICPGDVFRKPANSWTEFTTNNCSYEILQPGMDAVNLTNAYFRCPIHGHLGFADGTVFDGKRRRTKIY
jgi:hypothetical protein